MGGSPWVFCYSTYIYIFAVSTVHIDSVSPGGGLVSVLISTTVVQASFNLKSLTPTPWESFSLWGLVTDGTTGGKRRAFSVSMCQDRHI